jgi:(p)ppGpp synthase/HD superfamily hydrolase
MVCTHRERNPFVQAVPLMNMRHSIASMTGPNFVSVLENEGKLRIDDFIKGAMELAEDVHAGSFREDGSSSFLETHTWPVAVDVMRHYKSINRTITSVEIASAILHDISEDNDRILDLYKTKDYGFEAYLRYRFGNRVYYIATNLKLKDLGGYEGKNDEERQLSRFREYCDFLIAADYDIKVIKLEDRLNNMYFILNVAKHNKKVVYEKIKRYLREAEDFYLGYTMLSPKIPDLYKKLRSSYEQLRSTYYEYTLTMPQTNEAS